MTRTPPLLICLLTLACGGCVETRVIEERGVLSLRELQPGGLRPVRADQDTTAGGFETVLMTESLPGVADELDPLRRTMPDGTVRLYAFSPRHLVHHLLVTLTEGETELLNEWLVSTSLKEFYEGEGRRPEEAAEYLVKNARDIIPLLKLLPLGENTPGASFRDIGRNRFRLAPLGAEMLELRYHAIQMTIEERQFRFLLLE